MKAEKTNVPIHKFNCLITGATGFIGRHLVRVLLERGHSVRVLLRNPDRIKGLAGAEIFKGDVTVPESLVGIEAGIDWVIHCAGLLGKWGVSEKILYDVNVEGKHEYFANGFLVHNTAFCREHDGQVIKAGDGKVAQINPPNHFNCRSVLVAILIGDKDDPDSFYSDYPEKTQPFGTDISDKAVNPEIGFGGSGNK